MTQRERTPATNELENKTKKQFTILRLYLTKRKKEVLIKRLAQADYSSCEGKLIDQQIGELNQQILLLTAKLEALSVKT